MGEERDEVVLERFTHPQLLNFCLGFFGLQFAWQMEIILCGPVVEKLGGTPLLLGLIWLAGPVTGMVVQPFIGALSDKTTTKYGKRRPYIFFGALFASLALILFPNAANIANWAQSVMPFQLPVWTGLLIAALMVWVIDACVNAAQGQYRALIPDNMPVDQHSLANSYLSFAIGIGSVIAAGTAPFLEKFCGYQMSHTAQFVMAAIAFFGATIWTCMTIREVKKPAPTPEEIKQNDKTFVQNFVEFFTCSPEVPKICLVQFFTWIAIMAVNIYFTQFIVHKVMAIPEIANGDIQTKIAYIAQLLGNADVTAEIAKAEFDARILSATNFSALCFAVYNLVCFAVSLPIGYLSSKFGNKPVHIVSLTIMALAYAGIAFSTNQTHILIFMGLAGIGWASTLALPFAMLTRYIGKGSEGSVMGIFNLFIAAPQIIVCTLVSYFINHSQITTEFGKNYHFEYALLVGAVVLFCAAISALTIKEKQI